MDPYRDNARPTRLEEQEPSRGTKAHLIWTIRRMFPNVDVHGVYELREGYRIEILLTDRWGGTNLSQALLMRVAMEVKPFVPSGVVVDVRRAW